MIGVPNETADTITTFANVLEERAVTSRKPNIAILTTTEREYTIEESIACIQRSCLCD